MKQNIAYKFRIYPDERQKVPFIKTFDCVRSVYNKMPEDKTER
ncbi:MAG: helix-turn-helix domain-containing protein [Succinivibrio sp.]|nr:helix-turn-helix domain-containing protein [Succinivibrio sp.]